MVGEEVEDVVGVFLSDLFMFEEIIFLVFLVKVIRLCFFFVFIIVVIFFL